MTSKKKNPWLEHVKKFKDKPENKGKAFKEILKEAAKEWKK
jgi:hypothetical protein